MRKFFLLPLLITFTACSPNPFQKGTWNVNEAMIQCERARSKVSYPARCDDSSADTTDGYGEVWLLDTRPNIYNNIKKIWILK